MPRFDEPTYTIDADTVFTDGATGLTAAPALPDLSEPDGQPTLTESSDEPLVPVAHRRIRVLANYWHAGWNHAVPETMLRQGVLDRLSDVADGLPDEWGLAVFDAWRPLDLQIELYDTSVADPSIVDGFMAPPSHDPMTPPPHLSGGAVDLTLTYRGIPLALGCGFDDTTEAAYVDSLEATPGGSRDLRRHLFAAMTANDFVVYSGEWWHFEHGTRRWAAITGNPPRYAAISH